MDLEGMMLSKIPTSKQNSVKQDSKVEEKPTLQPPKIESSQVNIEISTLPSAQ